MKIVLFIVALIFVSACSSQNLFVKHRSGSVERIDLDTSTLIALAKEISKKPELKTSAGRTKYSLLIGENLNKDFELLETTGSKTITYTFHLHNKGYDFITADIKYNSKKSRRDFLRYNSSGMLVYRIISTKLEKAEDQESVGVLLYESFFDSTGQLIESGITISYLNTSLANWLHFIKCN